MSAIAAHREDALPDEDPDDFEAGCDPADADWSVDADDEPPAYDFQPAEPIARLDEPEDLEPDEHDDGTPNGADDEDPDDPDDMPPAKALNDDDDYVVDVRPLTRQQMRSQWERAALLKRIDRQLATDVGREMVARAEARSARNRTRRVAPGNMAA